MKRDFSQERQAYLGSISGLQRQMRTCAVLSRDYLSILSWSDFLHLLDVLWHCSDMEEMRIYYSLIFIVTLTTEVGAGSVHAWNKWCVAVVERELEMELTNRSVTELQTAHVSTH